MSIMPGYPVPRSQWAASGEACTACHKRFSFFSAKENCPCCGRLFCSACLSAECTLTPMGLPSAICLECFQKIQDWRRAHREQQRQEALQAATASAAAASPSPPAAEARLASLESLLGRLRQEGQQLRVENDSVVDLLAAKDTAVAELAEQRRRLTDERDGARREAEAAQQQLRALTAARDEATLALREVQGKLSTSQEAAASMEEKTDALLEANAILKSRITKLQTEAAEWHRRCEAASEADTQRNRTAADAQTALQSAAQELSELRKEREGLQTSVESSAAARRTLEAEVARLQATVAERERQLHLQQQQQAADGDASRSSIAAQSATQQQRLQELTEEAEVLRSTTRSLEAQLTEAEQRSTADRRACADAEGRVAALLESIHGYEEKEQRWKDVEKANDEVLREVRGKLKHATQEAAEARQQLSDSVKHYEGSTAALLSEKQATIDSLTLELHATQKSLETLQAQVSAAQDSTQALRDQLLDADAASEAKLSAAVAAVAAERDAARAALEERERAAADQTGQLTEARNALAELQQGRLSAAAEAKQEIGALRQQCAEARATYEVERQGWQTTLAELRAALASMEEQQHQQGTTAGQQAAPAAGPLDRTSRWSRPTRVAALRCPPSLLGEAGGSGIPGVAGLERWEFDTMAEAARGDAPDALVRIGYQIALDWLLFPSTDALRRWARMLDAVQSNYHANPYHNKVHAADVLQGVYALVLQCPGLLAHMTKTEKRAVVFAAAVHDVRHPGRTEAFLKHTFDPTYFAYNGWRVLEQMHTATAFQLLGDADLDFTRDDMDDAEVLRFHELVASLIAVTYMGSHATLMETWSRPLREGCSFDLSNAGDRQTVLGMLLHAADIGAQSRGVEVAVKWLGVVDEMWEQGDEEAALGLPVGPGNARGGDVRRGQIFFMEMFVIPLFDLVHQHFPAIEAPMRNLRTLHGHYSAATEQPQRPFPPPVAYAAAAEKQRAAAAAEEEQRRSGITTREEGVARRERAVEQAVERLRQATATVTKRESQLSEREAQLVARLSELETKSTGADLRRDSYETEEELHRAAEAVVEREAAVQRKAVELAAATAELEQREAVASQLSSQLATIAERVNRRRQLLRYREAQVRAREAAVAAVALRHGSEEAVLGVEATTVVALSNSGSREASPQLSPAAYRSAEMAKLKSALEKLSSAMSFM